MYKKITEQVYERDLDKRQKIEVKQDSILIYKSKKDYTAYIIDLSKDTLQIREIYIIEGQQFLDYYQSQIYFRKINIRCIYEAVACLQINNYVRRIRRQRIYSKHFKNLNLQVCDGLMCSQCYLFNKVIIRNRNKIIRNIKILNHYNPLTYHFQNELFFSVQHHFIIQYQKTQDFWNKLLLTDIRKGNKQFVGNLKQEQKIFDSQISPDLRFIYISPYLHKIQDFQEYHHIDGYVQFSGRFIISFKDQKLHFISLQNYLCEYLIDLSQFDQIIPQSINVQCERSTIIFMMRKDINLSYDERYKKQKILCVYKFESLQ